MKEKSKVGVGSQFISHTDRHILIPSQCTNSNRQTLIIVRYTGACTSYFMPENPMICPRNFRNCGEKRHTFDEFRIQD